LAFPDICIRAGIRALRTMTASNRMAVDRPSRSARVVAGAEVLLVDAGQEEDLVVHRHPERGWQHEHWREGLDRTLPGHADDTGHPFPLEDGHQDADGRTHR
jgi:hypothetical protein